MSETIEHRDYYFPNRIVCILLWRCEVMGKTAFTPCYYSAIAILLSIVRPDFELGMTFDEVGLFFEAVEGIYGIKVTENRAAVR